ncbi:MOSC domain-containing protein [Actinomycetota bacterium]
MTSPRAAGPHVAAVRLGPAREQTWGSRTLVTAAAKEETSGRVRLCVNGIPGDEQGNLKVHGGPDKAVLVYAASHYPRWAAEGVELPSGAFFENLTVVGLTEADVHIGDTWRVGSALTQVTQPRRPCATLGLRWGRRDLPRLAQASGRVGWYLRVLEEGEVGAGDTLELVDRPEGSVSAAETNRVMNVDRGDREGIERMLGAPGIPQAWRDKLVRRLGGELEDDSARLDGPAG